MAITISFRSDTEGFMTGVEKVKGELGRVRKKVNDNAKDWAKWASGIAGASAAAAVAIVKTSSTMGKELQLQIQMANATAEEFQRMAAGAAKYGTSSEKLADQLKDVNDKVADFLLTGAGPMADWFEQVGKKVGITEDAFRGLSGPQALQLYVKGMEDANLNQKEMTFFMEAIASDATLLLPLLKNGGKELNKYADAAEKMGLILDGFEIQQLADMDEKFQNMGKQMEMLKARIAVQLIPWFEALLKTINAVTGESVDFANMAGEGIQQLIKGVGFLADAFAGVYRVVPLINVAATGAIAAIANLVDFSIKMMDKFSNFALFVPKHIIAAINKVRAFFGQDPYELPKLSDTEFAQDVAKFAENTAGVLEDAKQRAHDAWMQPLPSESIKQWADRVVQETARAREAFRATNEEVTGDQGGGNGLTEGEKERLEAMKVYDDMRLEQQKSYGDRAQQFMQDQFSWETAATYEQGRKGLAAMAQHNKKAFELNKKAGIAEALISTYQGIAEAMKLPFPLNMAAAAATAAMGFAQVQSIRSQQFNGGGGGGAPSGGAVASGGAAAQGAAPAPQTFNMSIERVGEGNFLNESAMDTIFDNINDRIRDGQQLGSIGFSG